MLAAIARFSMAAGSETALLPSWALLLFVALILILCAAGLLYYIIYGMAYCTLCTKFKGEYAQRILYAYGAVCSACRRDNNAETVKDRRRLFRPRQVHTITNHLITILRIWGNKIMYSSHALAAAAGAVAVVAIVFKA